MVELEDSNDLFHNKQYSEIRARADQNGYILLRSLIDKNEILNVRKEFVSIFHKYKWINSKQEDMIYGTQSDNIAPKIEAIEDDEYWPVFDEIQCLESFHLLAHNKNLLNILDKCIFYDDKTLIHSRNIFRTLFPKHNYWKTPSHQDWVFIQGTENVWTTWIPLVDIPKDMGPLSILIGSHKYGKQLPLIKCEGAGGVGTDPKFIETLIDEKQCKWGISDFNMGDILMFPSLTIHKGTDNNTNNIRISTDFRYQPLSETIIEGSMLPHWGRMNWNDIYKNWVNNDIQYYWEKYNLNYGTFDASVTGNDETGAGERPLLSKYRY